MWLVWLAIIILFILIFFIPSREGLSSKQLYDIQAIINDSKYSINEKADLIYYNNEDASVLDAPIINIFKNTSLTNEEKIIALQDYFVSFVNERNNNPNSIYRNIPDKLTSEEFFKLNNMINTSFENDTEKILQIKSIGIKEKTFNDIINTTISDEAKISGDEVYTGPTITALINQILYGTAVPSNSSSSSSSKPSIASQASNVSNQASNVAKDVGKKLNPFDKKKK